MTLLGKRPPVPTVKDSFILLLWHAIDGIYLDKQGRIPSCGRQQIKWSDRNSAQSVIV